MRNSFLIFASTSILAAVIVPRKTYVGLYVLFFGSYPIIKYVIEAYFPRKGQRLIKFFAFNGILIAVVFALRTGLLPQVGLLDSWRTGITWIGVNIVFVLYDMGISRLIATIARLLPPDEK